MFRIRERLVEHNTRCHGLPVQLSIGTATAEKDNLSCLLSLADQRMYADKSTHKAKLDYWVEKPNMEG
jgi:GGDEF domain-containing protein